MTLSLALLLCLFGSTFAKDGLADLKKAVEKLGDQMDVVTDQLSDMDGRLRQIETKIPKIDTEQLQDTSIYNISFFAKKVASLDGPNSSPIRIRFENAVTNFGVGYDSLSGEFVAPAKGMYIFHVTAVTVNNIFDLPSTVGIYRMGNLIQLLEASRGDNSASMSVAVELDLFDRVYCELEPDSLLRGEDWSTFSGYHLFPIA